MFLSFWASLLEPTLVKTASHSCVHPVSESHKLFSIDGYGVVDSKFCQGVVYSLQHDEDAVSSEIVT
jgi:hypothetical protein